MRDLQESCPFEGYALPKIYRWGAGCGAWWAVRCGAGRSTDLQVRGGAGQSRQLSAGQRAWRCALQRRGLGVGGVSALSHQLPCYPPCAP